MNIDTHEQTNLPLEYIALQKALSYNVTFNYLKDSILPNGEEDINNYFGEDTIGMLFWEKKIFLSEYWHGTYQVQLLYYLLLFAIPLKHNVREQYQKHLKALKEDTQIPYRPIPNYLEIIRKNRRPMLKARKYPSAAILDEAIEETINNSTYPKLYKTLLINDILLGFTRTDYFKKQYFFSHTLVMLNWYEYPNTVFTDKYYYQLIYLMVKLEMPLRLSFLTLCDSIASKKTTQKNNLNPPLYAAT